MRVFAISIQKGGAGKSTTAAAFAQAAAYRGQRALLIDLDPQGNSSFLVKADATRLGAYDLLNGNPAAGLIQDTAQGVHVIPANWALATMKSGPGSARRLQKAIEPVKKDYDFIFIDTPSAAGEMQYNAMQAATDLIIPVQADTLSLQAFYQTTDTARQFGRSNPGLTRYYVLFTQYDARGSITRTMRGIIEDKAAAQGVASLGAIRGAVAIKEAAALQASLFKYAPRSNPARDYLQAFDDLTGNTNQ